MLFFLTFSLVFFVVYDFTTLFKPNQCLVVSHLVMNEVFWIFHSFFCSVALFIMFVMHPNAYSELYGSIGFNYQQLLDYEEAETLKMPISV